MKEDDSVIKHTKKNKWIIHGGQALNKQLPQSLLRPTKDWDLWATNPHQAMDKLEKELDRESGGDYYYVQTIPLIGSRTGEQVYRVISRLTGEEVADFMKTPNDKNLYIIISGIRWETLEHAKMIYEKIIKDPATRLDRKGKARMDLNRILAFERQLGKNKEQIQINKLPDMFHFAPVRFARPNFVRGW